MSDKRAEPAMDGPVLCTVHASQAVGLAVVTGGCSLRSWLNGHGRPVVCDALTVDGRERIKAYQADMSRLYCPKGHRMTLENTLIEPRGRGEVRLRCKACKRGQQRRRRERQRAAEGDDAGGPFDALTRLHTKETG